ncbi:MAG: alpha/beta fold hydrolase [Leucobacter sp.]
MSTLDDEFRFLSSDAARVERSAALPTVERISVDIGEGRRVSALSWEPESAPEFVFLHGAGLNAHSFDPTVLAMGVPALAVDLPGHGRSDWREDANYRPDLLAGDIGTVLAERAPEPVTLVGHSLGGLTAMLAAAAAPGGVRRLVIVDISPGVIPQRDAGTIAEFITGKRDYGTQEEIVDRAIAFGIGSDREALTRGVALNTRRRADGRWEWMHHLAHLDGLPIAEGDDPAPFAPLWAVLESLQAAGVPLALIAASDGLVGPELREEWAERLPGSAVLTVDGPHNLHEAAPVGLARALESLDVLVSRD